MKTLLRMSLAAAAAYLLSAGHKPRQGTLCPISTMPSMSWNAPYAGYPDKTGPRAKYAPLKGRLQSEISGDRDAYDAVAEYLG